MSDGNPNVEMDLGVALPQIDAAMSIMLTLEYGDVRVESDRQAMITAARALTEKASLRLTRLFETVNQ